MDFHAHSAYSCGKLLNCIPRLICPTLLNLTNLCVSVIFIRLKFLYFTVFLTQLTAYWSVMVYQIQENLYDQIDDTLPRSSSVMVIANKLVAYLS